MSIAKQSPNPPVNNFSLSIATINGSGSQTSNGVLLRTFFKMGIPVTGKNLFPSNIQGLPTWYVIRLSKDGYLARRDPYEIAVCMNNRTAAEDMAKVAEGGIVLYDDAITIAARRPDVTYYPLPVSKLVKEANVAFELRDYIANMTYVGALVHLLDIDMAEIEAAVDWNFDGKRKPIDLNMDMVRRSYEWAQANLVKTDPYRVERMTGFNEDKILVDGNTAAALGCIWGGVSVVGWYPITPASSVVDALNKYLPKLRTDPETGKATFAVVQAEDELAAIGMVVGAGWAGARAMTSTSGPGLDLMAEFAGLAYFAEVPAVIWDIQRVGPSTGLPTRTSQADILSAYYLSHGDTRYPLLFPADPTECFEFGNTAFDLAERLQTLVMVLSDLDIGMNVWITDRFQYSDKPLDRGKVLDAEQLSALAGVLGALQGCGRRRHRLSHAARHAAPRRRLLHPRHRAHRLCHLQRAAGGLGGQPGPSGPQARYRAHARARPDRGRDAGRPDRHHQHRLQPPGHRRGAGYAQAAPASKAPTCGCAPCRSTTRCVNSCMRSKRCSWSRTTTTASCTRSCFRKSRCVAVTSCRSPATTACR